MNVALEQEGKKRMQLVTSSGKSLSAAGADVAEVSVVTGSRYAEYGTIRRNSAVLEFDPGKIPVALTKPFPAIEGGQGAPSARMRELVAGLIAGVVGAKCADVQGISAPHPERRCQQIGVDQLYRRASKLCPG